MGRDRLGYDFDKTHERILSSATRHFMEAGFSGASIRQICRDAGVTNGAFYAHFKSKEDLFSSLVEPALQGLYELYGDEHSRYGDIKSKADILAAFEQSFSSDRTIIHYIYEHKVAFLLLLKAGGGTAYERFPSMLAEEEKQVTEAFFDECRPYIGRPENLSDNIVSKLSYLVVSTVFDCFLLGKTEEETIRETQLASEFCLAGLRKIWGI